MIEYIYKTTGIAPFMCCLFQLPEKQIIVYEDTVADDGVIGK